MRFWILAAIALMLVAAPDSAQSQNSAASGATRSINLTGDFRDDVYGQPGGQVSIYPAGSLMGNFAEDFPDNMVYRVHNLACRSGWYTANTTRAAAAEQFYVIYLIVADPPQTIRVQTFNTVCSSGGGGGFAGNGSYSSLAYMGDHPFDLEIEGAVEGLFTSGLTVEVYIESHNDVLIKEMVLSGTDPAPN